MKINWGTGILIVIIVFFIAIFSFIFFSTTQKVNLVEEDYYPKELDFDTQMDKIRNTNNLDEKILFEFPEELIVISFPEIVRNKTPNGSILIYRPSDYEDDITIDIQLNDDNQQILSSKELLAGKYIIKIDWELEGIRYYQEKSFINR